MGITYYTYLLKYPDGTPFYVGKGTGDRMYVHEKKVKKGKIPHKNKHLFNTIKKILDSNQNITYEIIIETQNEKEAYQKEYEIILEIGIDNLCNIVESYGRGGRITGDAKKRKIAKLKGRTLSDEHRKLLSEAHTGKKLKPGQHQKGIETRRNSGKPWHSNEWRNYMSKKMSGKNNLMYGKSLSDDHLQRLKAGRDAYSHSDEIKAKLSKMRSGGGNPSAKPVYDSEFEIIYDCIKYAAQATGLSEYRLRKILADPDNTRFVLTDVEL